jgi:serine/threonine protein phosphatase PrpC
LLVGKPPRTGYHGTVSDRPSGSDETMPGARLHGEPGETSGRHRTLKLLASSSSSLRSLADALKLERDPGVSAEVAGMTDTGRVRANNQDQFLIAALERSILVEASSLSGEGGTRLTDTPQGRLLIVADGIGGHGGGEVASAVAIDAMAHYAFEAMPWALAKSSCSAEELADGLRDAMRKAQDRVRRVAKRKALAEDMGTTLTMAYVAWPDLFIVHAGDSRAYLFRDDELHRLTRDHTLAQQLVDGHALSEEEAEASHLSHVLVNAVGGVSDDLDVEFHHVRLQLDDQVLLCTDGLHGYVKEADIVTQLRRTGAPVERIVSDLVGRANEAGGPDNVTAVLARF